MKTLKLDKISELRELDEDGSDSILRELINLYLSSTPEKLQNLQKYFNNKDYLLVRKEAHSIRSSSLALGVEKMALTVFDIEYAPEKDDLDYYLNELIKKALIEFEDVKKDLTAYL